MVGVPPVERIGEVVAWLRADEGGVAGHGPLPTGAIGMIHPPSTKPPTTVGPSPPKHCQSAPRVSGEPGAVHLAC
jgi:hypothetical protein